MEMPGRDGHTLYSHATCAVETGSLAPPLIKLFFLHSQKNVYVPFYCPETSVFKKLGEISAAFIARYSQNKVHEVSLPKIVCFPTYVTLFGVSP